MNCSTRTHRHTTLWLGLAACTAVAAQEVPASEAPLLAQADIERIVEFSLPFEFGGGGEGGSERVVKGAPYCADAVHETVQWLPDGTGGAPNRIVRQQATRLCRDGEGRTRQEVERGGRKLVYLRDPAARENWVLDPERKSARRLLSPRDLRSGMADSAAWREYGERMREFARSTAERARQAVPGQAAPGQVAPVPSVPPMPPMPPLPVVIDSPEPGAAPGRRHEMRVMRMNRDGETAEWTLPPAAVQWRAQSLAPRGAGSVTPLPAKDIEGVRANGERTSWVIEAGKVGNEKPIHVVREVWTSPELMITVMSRDFDPRSGETGYRLKNLKRGEPEAALMRVPTDFAKPARPSANPSPRASAPAG